MRSYGVVPKRATTVAQAHGTHLASFLFLLVTSLKLNVLEFSINMDSEMQDA
jgi:hypothetical protein